MSSVGLVLLAAGASTRMGTPKQLLPYRGRSLIQQMVEVAIASVCQPVLVVLGANADRIQPQLHPFNLSVVETPDWNQGMSASIRAGIQTLQTLHPTGNAAVLMVCDQPFVSTQLINQLVATYQTTHKPIVASEYAGTVGVPALFDRTFFPDLLTLQGDRGAQKIIQPQLQNTARISWSQGAIDLDTLEDYQQWLSIHD